MKVSFVVAISLAVAAASIAPASADDRRTPRAGVAAGPGCTGGVWPAFAACKNVYNYKTYSDCHTEAVKMGWRGNDIWWYCSSLGLKS